MILRLALGLAVAAALAFAVVKLMSKEFANPGAPPAPQPPAAPDATGVRLDAIAEAIARAEGFGVEGSIPWRAKNPGDMKLGDRFGLGTINGITIYPKADSNAPLTDRQDGWAALKREIRDITGGSSATFNAWAQSLGKASGADLTIAEIAQHWTATEPAAWAQNVADSLGVGTDTLLVEA